MANDEQPKLGCRAFELEIGTEFSDDGGLSWLTVRTEPAYYPADANCENRVLHFMASPAEDPCLSAWQDVMLDDYAHVLLEREWGRKK